MNEWISKKCKNVMNSVIIKPYIYGFLCSLIVLVILPFLIWLIYYIGDSGFVLINTSLKVGEALYFYGVLLTFVSTVFLSSLVLWQNIRFNRENKLSQDHIEKLSEQANEIYRQLLSMEKDKFRPYIKVDSKIVPFFAVSKGAFGFCDDIEHKMNECNIGYQGVVPFDKDYEKNLHSFFPSSMVLIFGIENIGQAVISEMNLTKLAIFDGVTGSVEGILGDLNSSIWDKETRMVCLNVSSQVLATNDGEMQNKIFNKYESDLRKPFKALQVELAFSYKDIYGRTYWQEYTFRIQYDLETIGDKGEYIMKITHYVVEHHTGHSPYNT